MNADRCVADDCTSSAVPADGPFCPSHDWSNWRRSDAD